MASTFHPQYFFDKALGAGTFGEVYWVHNQRAENFALKVLKAPPGSFKAPPGEMSPLAREVELLARLQHPHLVKVYDYLPEVSVVSGLKASGPGFLMEYLPGKSLAELQGKLSAADAEAYFVQALSALEYLHRRRLLHGDLKPENLRLDAKGKVKLLDFGLASHWQADQKTKERTVKGTPAYLPPEALGGHATPRSDLFSLAALFYFLLSGKLPFSTELPLQQRFATRPEFLHQRDPQISQNFSEVIARLLEVQEEERFSSAAVVRRSLQSQAKAGAQEIEAEDLTTLPFVAREKDLEDVLTKLKLWHRGSTPAPAFLIQGTSGMGKTRLCQEILWQAQLQGIATQALTEQDWATWQHSFHNSEKTLVWLKDFYSWSEAKRLEVKQKLRQAMQVKQADLAWVVEWQEGERNSKEASPSFDLPFTDKIALAPLSFVETQALLEEIPLSRSLSPQEQEQLYQTSEGNPSLWLALVAWLQPRLAGESPLSLHPSGLQDFELPENLAQDLAQQWQVWTETERRFLSSLALFSEGVPSALLEEDLGLDQQAFNILLEKFSASGWLVQDQGQLQLAQPFKSKNLLQQNASAALQALGTEWLQKVHSRAEEFAFLPLTQKARIAQLAGDLSSFGHYGISAAKALLASGQALQALRLFEEVLGAAPSPAEQTTCHAHRAAAYNRLGRYAEALQAYEKWYALTEDDGTKIQTLKFHYLCGLTLLNLGKFREAQQRLEQALNTGDSVQHPHHRPFHLKAWIQLGKVAEKQNELEAAKQAYDQGLALTQEDSPEKTQLLRNLGLLALKEEDAQKAQDYFEAALKMSEALDYQEGVANNAYVLAGLRHQEGDYEGALKLYDRVLALAHQKQDPLKEARTLCNQAAVLIERADYGRALEYGKAAQDIFSETPGSSEDDRLLLGFQQRACQVYLGQFQGILDKKEWKLAQQKNSVFMLAHLKRLEAECYRLQRQFSQALLAYEASQQLFHQAQEPREFWLTCLLEIFTECLAGDLAAAQKKLQKLSETTEASTPRRADWQLLAHTLDQWLADSAAPDLGEVQKFLEDIAQSPQQELSLLSLLAFAEILTRRQQSEGAALLRRRAWEWLEGLARTLPEELAFTFQRREDYQRLAEHHQKSFQLGGLSRERFLSFAKINQRLSEERDMHSILQQVMDAAMDLAGAERGFLLLREEKKPEIGRGRPMCLPQMGKGGHAGPPLLANEKVILQDSVYPIPGYRIEAAHNLKKENLESEEFKISRSVVEQALRHRRTILTDNAQADPDFEHAASVHLYQLKSILVVPLVRVEIGSHDCLGALYLDHRFEVGAFSEESLLFLKAFADQAVLAIEKAKTLSDLEAAKQSLEHQVKDQASQIETMETELKEARQGLRHGYEEIIGHSPKMIQVLSLVDRVTDTLMPVWIHGESGTGKELIARALHFNSDRKDKPFITENCSAIPENLLESILFGHVKGAFTHADRNKKGLFAAAEGGTIFLDEIGDMPLSMQAKLLRVLQEGEIRPVGATESVAIDVRVVTATNKDLPQLVKRGKFREDLFFRINGLKIELPALRERKEDLPPLTHYFIQKISQETALKPCAIDQEALSLLAQYDWPGNIRELENTLRNAVLFAEGGIITPETLSFKPELNQDQGLSSSYQAAPSIEVGTFKNNSLKGAANFQAERGLVKTLEDFGERSQREAMLQALAKVGYHKGEAAKELGITPRHLYNLLEKHGLPKNKWALRKLWESERQA